MVGTKNIKRILSPTGKLNERKYKELWASKFETLANKLKIVLSVAIIQRLFTRSS